MNPYVFNMLSEGMAKEAVSGRGVMDYLASKGEDFMLPFKQLLPARKNYREANKIYKRARTGNLMDAHIATLDRNIALDTYKDIRGEVAGRAAGVVGGAAALGGGALLARKALQSRAAQQAAQQALRRNLMIGGGAGAAALGGGAYLATRD